jgi:hypothetical protein
MNDTGRILSALVVLLVTLRVTKSETILLPPASFTGAWIAIPLRFTARLRSLGL